MGGDPLAVMEDLAYRAPRVMRVLGKPVSRSSGCGTEYVVT